MKNNKGVTLISLIVTVIIILILTSVMIFNTKNQLQMKEIQNLRIDIENLVSKVDNYYLKYGELPILCDYTNSDYTNFTGKSDFSTLIGRNAQTNNSVLSSQLNAKDSDKYAVIDLEKLPDLSLNFGYNNQYAELKSSKNIMADSDIEDEIYVINIKTHQIYYPHGIFADRVMYYTF